MDKKWNKLQMRFLLRKLILVAIPQDIALLLSLSMIITATANSKIRNEI